RDWNREAVTGVVARGAGDRAVDADHFTALSDEGTTRVARVDRGGGLNQVADRVLIGVVGVHQLGETAALGADDSGGDGVLEPERIADRQNPLADAGRGIVTE